MSCRLLLLAGKSGSAGGRNPVTNRAHSGDFLFFRLNFCGLGGNGRLARGGFGGEIDGKKLAVEIAPEFYALVAVPGGLEVGYVVAAGHLGLAHALHPGSDAEGAEQLRQALGVDGAIGLPAAVLLAVQPVEEEGGGEALGIAVAGEAEVEVIEELAVGVEVEVIAFVEDEVEGAADVTGPGATDLVGELEERFDELHAAGVETREATGKILFGVGGTLLEVLEMLVGPGGEALLEGVGKEFGGAEAEALNGVGSEAEVLAARHGLEDDGDGVLGEVLGELAGDGEGFGAEDGAVLGSLEGAVAEMRAVGEEGAEGGVFGAEAGAEDGLGVVEEDGGRGIEAHAVDEGGSAEGGGERGVVAEQGEDFEAEGLAGLRFRGEDGEIGSDRSGGEGPGVESPESEEVAVVVRAMEIAGDELAKVGQELGAVYGRGKGGIGFGLG